jgi:hypothetical protein
MPTFVQKPIEVEAVQLPITSAPAWLADAMDAGSVFIYNNGQASIDLPEGDELFAGTGDWIICGPDGRIYMCKEKMFSAIYAAV